MKIEVTIRFSDETVDALRELLKPDYRQKIKALIAGMTSEERRKASAAAKKECGVEHLSEIPEHKLETVYELIESMGGKKI